PFRRSTEFLAQIRLAILRVSGAAFTLPRSDFRAFLSLGMDPRRSYCFIPINTFSSGRQSLDNLFGLVIFHSLGLNVV
ncbi:hypothetical protein C8R45DRAFT_989132, partial [Mycena sanguinolenta]